jgi:hypothetical protein
MIEENSNSKREIVISKPLAQRMLKQSFVSGKELITLMFKNSFEVYRVDGSLHKIAQIDKSQIGMNISAADYVWSPDGLTFCYSTSKPKVFCYNLGDPSIEKRTISSFNDSRKIVYNLRWFDSKYDILASYDCLRSLEDTEKKSKNPSQNLLESFLKCSYSHVFAMKEILNKIQTLEGLITKGGKITVLSGIDQDWILRLSFNGVLDFGKIQVGKYILLPDETKNMKYEFSNDFSKLYFMYLVQNNSELAGRNRFNLELTIIDCSDFSTHFKEYFLAFFSLQNIKEILSNVRIGYYSSKTTINEIRTKLKNFFGETDVMEEETLNELKNLIQWKSEGDTFLKFFENIDLKRLYELSESINNNFNILIDFFMESFYPSLQRASAYLQDLKHLMTYFECRKIDHINAEYINTMDTHLVAAMKTVHSLIEIIINKKLELKNFCLFCFKWKIKASPNAKNMESEEFRAYNESVFDFEILLKYLSSTKSIFLDDLIFSSEDEPLLKDELVQRSSLSIFDKNFEFEQEILEKELDLVIDKNQANTRSPIRKGLKEILRTVESSLTPLFEDFIKSISNKVTLQSKTTLLEGVGEDFDFDLSKGRDKVVCSSLIQNNLFVYFNLQSDIISVNRPIYLNSNQQVPIHLYSFDYNNFMLSLINISSDATHHRLQRFDLNDFWKDSTPIISEQLNEERVILEKVLKSPFITAHAESSHTVLNVKEITDMKTNFSNMFSVHSEGKLLIIQY